MERDDVKKVAGFVAVGAITSYVLTSEPVQNGLNSLEKKLKSNGHDIVGGAVGILKNFLGDFGNVAKASPYVPAVPGLSDKITFEQALKIFKKGDHIAVDRIGHYTHHGIYEGYNKVIEYGDDRSVRRVTLRRFLESSFRIYRIDSQAIYSPDEIVRRARRRLGESKYNLFLNNCEQFARWCRNGD